MWFLGVLQSDTHVWNAISSGATGGTTVNPP